MASKKKKKTRAATSKRAARSGYGSALATATSADAKTSERVKAIELLIDSACEDSAFDALVTVLKDREAPTKVRYAALATLQAASFSTTVFQPCRARYLAALRSLASDPDLELRARALGLLSREKDGKTQQRLLEGLRDPSKALLPPEKALQLLAYDVHGEAYDVARAVVKKPPNAVAKREALRLLAADASAGPVFEKVLRDKKESAENRQVAASALHTIAPKKLQAHAREILLDEDEDEDVQAVGLTAVTQFGTEHELASDAALKAGVGRLERRAASAPVRARAAQFLDKYSDRK